MAVRWFDVWRSPAAAHRCLRRRGSSRLGLAPAVECYPPRVLAQRIDELLAGRRRVLLAGCGGGYDVVGAVPLLAELEEAGHEVHLASLSFSYLNGLDGALRMRSVPNLYEVPASAATPDAYCPEAWLARFLETKLGGTRSVWGFEKTGVVPLRAAYEHLVQCLGIDTIILVDGGIDSLLRGDESALGTPSEDMASLAAVSALDVPTKVLACVGMGAEMRDGICHEQVLARIGELTACGAYLGACALLPQTRAGALYREAVEFLFDNQSSQRTSHVHRVVLAASGGEYGARGEHVWLSPLLSLYWFFSLQEVAAGNLLVSHLMGTETIWEIAALIEGVRKSMRLQDRSTIPL